MKNTEKMQQDLSETAQQEPMIDQSQDKFASQWLIWAAHES